MIFTNKKEAFSQTPPMIRGSLGFEDLGLGEDGGIAHETDGDFQGYGLLAGKAISIAIADSRPDVENDLFTVGGRKVNTLLTHSAIAPINSHGPILVTRTLVYIPEGDVRYVEVNESGIRLLPCFDAHDISEVLRVVVAIHLLAGAGQTHQHHQNHHHHENVKVFHVSLLGKLEFNSTLIILPSNPKVKNQKTPHKMRGFYNKHQMSLKNNR
jgi:hypothetical protein